MSSKDVFEAAQAGDVEAVKRFLQSGVDPSSKNEYGFTALHCAAMGTNSSNVEACVAIMRLLINAGSSLEELGSGGRTALYLAAEFSPSVEPVQLLIDAGAHPDVKDEFGNHVVKNAYSQPVKDLLSRVTGVPIPKPPPPEPARVKLTAKDWKRVKEVIDPVFDTLSSSNLIVLQDAGATQEDGFEDGSEKFREKGGESAGIKGFCFYSRQDLNWAKKTSQLTLSFWGAPEGADEDMKRVGKQIVEAFQQAGFDVNWDGSGGMRPTVYLQSGL